jgi:hypothetical protein
MEPAGSRDNGQSGLREGLLDACDKLTRLPVLAFFAFLSASLVALVGIQYHRGLQGPLSAAGDHVVVGDFVAFYTGARIIADGRGAELYDLRSQRELQDEWVGKSFPEWQPYVNPPLLAIAMWPLAGTGLVSAFGWYTVAMVLCGLFGAGALVGLTPALSRTPLGGVTVALLALSFHPIARTMLGGQNSVLTWALLTGGAWALERRREWLAGVLLGLLSYKPQYVPFLAALFVFVRAWRGVAAALAVAILHYALGALVAGSDWPLRMLAALRRYRPIEWAESLDTHFSLLPFFDQVAGGAAGRILAAAAIGAVIAALWRYAPRVRPGSEAFPLLWSLVVVAGMLVSPHLQYYDFALLVSPVAIGFDRLVASGSTPALPLRLLAATIYVGYPWFSNARHELGFQPLTIWTLAVYLWLLWVAWRQ